MSKLTSAQLTAYNKGDFVKPVFHLYVIENTKTGFKYVTVRQNMSGKAFMRIVEADAKDQSQRIPLLWSVRKYGINAHEIRRIATYTDRIEARVVAAKMIEDIALKGLSINGGRPRVGATETFFWGSPKNEAKKVIATKTTKSKNKPAKSAPVLEASA